MVGNRRMLDSLERTSIIEKIEETLSRKVLWTDLSTLITILMVCSYALSFSCFTIMKHNAFRTYAWDLGIFNQAFWTTVKYGKLFYNTPEIFINPSGSFLGTHFSPILFLILPIYAIYPAPETLLVIQSLILALGAVPLYKLSMHVLKNRIASLTFVLAYLLYPPLQGVNWFDFHVQAFLPLFFLSSIYFLEKKNWKMYFVFIILALACEEHAAFIVIFIGLFIALRNRIHLKEALKTKNFRDTVFLTATATAMLAIIWYFITLWIRETFFPVNTTFISVFKASANWSILGAPDPILIPAYIILYPQRAIAALQYEFLIKIGYIVILFCPLAFFSFHKVEFLLPTLPWFVYSLFSNYQSYYVIYDQYPAYVAAFIFISALYSLSGLSLTKAKTRRLIAIFLCSLVSFSVASPTSSIVSTFYDTGIRPPTCHEQFIQEVLSYVPANASIITQNNIFVHVSDRIDAYVVPIDILWNKKNEECEKFVNDVLENVDYVLVDIKSDGSAAMKLFSVLNKRADFKVLVSADGVVLFKKNYEGNALMLAPYNFTYFSSDLNLYAGEIVTELNATDLGILHFNGSLGGAPLSWSSPRTLLPPGNYIISLKMKINGTSELFTLELCSNNGQSVLKSEIFSEIDITPNSWMNYTLQFSTEKPLVDFEIRAVNITRSADFYLYCIEVKQTS